ncbi:cytochrome ubiquinol oxidase subunit I [Desulfogranum mediterraneum]|uniref:cytochrome ubiquinol oxidase subunit I n=1 Tax=Desulfogranum mediterraneum TaxID=160661 RepID=UPI00040EE811|nr:cytochrome ubiquinol oxidase subunit I [Desulfogranum mediterraneum]
MNYPVWQLDFFGGGLLIAAIAVFHVYISHFAVGGGLFLVLAERKAHREGNPAIMEYVRRHARFFLLVTMVAGGITGVGIWFTIALLNPAATSVLIHTFVFAWAAEWVFFVIEIVALFLYYYTFGRLSRKHHLLIGWIYFGAAWMSLFIINGIIDFMLTPGSWPQDQNFWSGFFNPTFWPALAFRSFFALLIAGLFGFVTATWSKDARLRLTMTRYAALWLLLPFALFIASGYWYMTALPAELRELVFQRMPMISYYLNGFLLLSPVLVLGGLLLAIRMPASITRPMAVLMLVIGLIYMGCFEFIREGGRRPYIISNYMYSNSIFTRDLEQINQEGVLSRAKWSRHKTITPDNRLAAGRELYNILCLSCHAVDGPMHNIRPLTANFTPSGLDAMLSGMATIHPTMPPYAGTAQERFALATYLAYGLHGNQDPAKTTPIQAKEVELPPFDQEQDDYVLLAWSTTGMHSLSDGFDFWALQPPASTIRAQLIRRGETPELVSEEVNLLYRLEPAFLDPAARSSFWENAQSLFAASPADNIGLSGSPLQGMMSPEEGSFTAEQLPILPYPDGGGFDPYPMVTIEARDPAGRVLATTRVAAPVSTEMGCYQCHGGQWRVDKRAGLSAETAANVLAIHDRLSQTELLAAAEQGAPRSCRSCHPARLDSDGGDGQLLSLSASIHGFHAHFLRERGAGACGLCHPSSPDGASQSFRGVHDAIGLDCTSCHGQLEDHALGLLKAEALEGKARAAALAKGLAPQTVENPDEIVARQPWVNQPDCLNCHQEFEQPETDTSFNQWTAAEDQLYRNRSDESSALFCQACHAAAHGEYPAANDYGQLVHNLQPLQYQGNTLPLGSELNCALCHTVAMEDEMHHPNMLREFRNQ